MHRNIYGILTVQNNITQSKFYIRLLAGFSNAIRKVHSDK